MKLDNEIAAPTSAPRCWVCGSDALTRVRESSLPDVVTEETFRISSADYGHTGAIDRCDTCGFHQCTDMTDVLKYYETMDDPAYKQTHSQRALQQSAMLQAVPLKTDAKGLRLLDVGTGIGILVQEARRMGYEAIGVEPSQKLQAHAVSLGLPVVQGVLPHPEISGPFDVVTIIDVIEHVTDPVDLLRSAADLLAPGGILVVVTPDRSSIAAATMGRRWWHYRVAHISYFEPETLEAALGHAGLRQIGLRRPTWYFPMDYLAERALGYMPRWLRFPVPRVSSKITVPLNLRDSIMVFAEQNR